MTTHFSTHFRRPIALLTGLSLVVGLFMITPATTSAQSADPTPDYLASFDACPENVIPDAGFTDVSSRHPNVDDIDCIAYYGITKGTSPTTYAPENSVIREHMALFLTRLARLVGIDLPSPGATPFTDIGDLSQESQDAISQIYQLRITIGATTTTYAPARDVTRGEMALFLVRLMNLMDPVVDGRDAHGYIPDDVDANRDRFAIESPYRDLTALFVETFDAITHLYELGVGSGKSSTTYGADDDMTRAAMAEFMAGILDHSNLRPAGTTVQVTPTTGLDDFDITMMISHRDSSFNPVEDQPVDWFYTDDEDGGLVRGVCDDDLIQPSSADCVWDVDDDETDRDGNIFEDRIEATAGETMTFYAWVGRRDREEFDDRAVDFSKAVARSAKGADAISVTWRERDIPPNALQVDGAYIVDLGINSIDFTIQLQDDLGNDLELEGIEIEVEVESRDIAIGLAPPDTGGRLEPSITPFGSRDDSDATLLTDDDGEAVFELDAPRRDDRLDRVVFTPDCQRCAPFQVEIAWSEADPVLVSVHPQFDLYQFKSSSSRVSLQVEYQMYDQYGERVTGVSASATGRTGTTARAKLAYSFHSWNRTTDTVTPHKTVTAEAFTTARSGLFREAVSETIPDANRGDEGFFLVLNPSVFSDSNDNSSLDANELRYLPEDAVVVWFVTEATGTTNLPGSCEPTWPGGLTPPVIQVNSAEREFRTCFVLWSYDSNDRFLVDGEDLSIEDFETQLKQASLAELSVVTYSTRSSVRSIFQISSS